MILTAKKNEKISPLKAAINILLVGILVIGIFWLSLATIGVRFDFGFIGDFSSRIWKGLGLTVVISLGSLVVSLCIGILSGTGQASRILVLRYLSKGYVKLIRGTPLIMQIYLFYYIIGTAWGIENRIVAGIIILSIFEGAYIAEIIRGSFISIDETQLEAARAVGFDQRQTLRYVILPQMVARTLPALTGQFASIIKDSSLLSIIAVIELTQTMREISASNFKIFECYVFLGILYLCLTLPIAIISEKLERRFNYAN
ncbi:MAG: amino acid ABC transporter permease [Anaerovoracaceae bacterium]